MFLIVINTLLVLFVSGIDWRAHVGGVVAGFVAGWLAEGVGPRSVRQVVQVAGLLGLVAIGIVVTALRVASFPA